MKEIVIIILLLTTASLHSEERTSVWESLETEVIESIAKAKRFEQDAFSLSQKVMGDQISELELGIEREGEENQKLAGELAELRADAAAYEEELNEAKGALVEQESRHRTYKEKMLSEMDLLDKTLCEEKSLSAKLRKSFDEVGNNARNLEKQLDVLTNALVGKQRELDTLGMENCAREDDLKCQILAIQETYAKEKKQKDALIRSFIDQLEGFKSE